MEGKKFQNCLHFRKQQTFKVYVVLPLLPGFDRMETIKAVQYYNLRSITFGPYSIYKALKKEGITDPSKYITFHGMRNWYDYLKYAHLEKVKILKNLKKNKKKQGRVDGKIGAGNNLCPLEADDCGRQICDLRLGKHKRSKPIRQTRLGDRCRYQRRRYD